MATTISRVIILEGKVKQFKIDIDTLKARNLKYETMFQELNRKLAIQNSLLEIGFPKEIDLSAYNFGTYAVPSSTPAYLGTATNTVTGTKTTRIADGNVSAFNNLGDVIQIRHGYSKRSAFNSDGSLIILSGNNPAFLLNGNTYAVVASLTNGHIWANNTANKYFNSYDNVFAVGTINTSTYVKTGTQSRTFTDYVTMNVQSDECNIDNNDTFVALYGTKASTGTNCWVVVYNIATNTIVTQTQLSTPISNIDWVSVCQDGTRVVVQYNTTGSGTYAGTKSYNQSLAGVVHLMDAKPHGDLGVDINGDQVFVGAQFTGNYGISMVNLLTGVTTGLWLKTAADYPNLSHISCRNLGRPGWAYLSGGEDAATFNRYPSHLKQITVKLDPANQNVGEFWGWNNARQGNNKYDHQAHGVPSRDGKKFLFASDWDNATLEAQTYAPAWVMEKQ